MPMTTMSAGITLPDSVSTSSAEPARLAEAGDVLAERQADAVARHMPLDIVGHLGVHRRHELVDHAGPA